MKRRRGRECVAPPLHVVPRPPIRWDRPPRSCVVLRDIPPRDTIHSRSTVVAPPRPTGLCILLHPPVCTHLPPLPPPFPQSIMNKLLLALVATMALFANVHACDDFANLACSSATLKHMHAAAADIVADPILACAHIAEGAACSMGLGCYPSYTNFAGVAMDSKVACQAAGQQYACPSATCDSGSMATPMVPLFAVIAAMLYKLM